MIQDLLTFKISDIFIGNDHSICFGSLRDLSKKGKNVVNNNIFPMIICSIYSSGEIIQKNN